MSKYLSLLALAALVLAGCGKEEAPEPAAETPEAGGDESHDAKHGGEVTVVGDHEFHIEVAHDQAAGVVTMYVYDGDMKDAKPDEAPVLNVMLDPGTAKIVGVEKEGVWTFQHEALAAGHPGGRFLIKFGGKTYTPEFLHVH